MLSPILCCSPRVTRLNGVDFPEEMFKAIVEEIENEGKTEKCRLTDTETDSSNNTQVTDKTAVTERETLLSLTGHWKMAMRMAIDLFNW